jgi:hypothetical protein
LNLTTGIKTQLLLLFNEVTNNLKKEGSKTLNGPKYATAWLL